MKPTTVAANDSVSLEFENGEGAFRATLLVRPKARPDGSLVVNTEIELFERSTGATDDAGDQWSELGSVGVVADVPQDETRCGGGVGSGLGKAEITVSWDGERVGSSGVRLTGVTIRLTATYED